MATRIDWSAVSYVNNVDIARALADLGHYDKAAGVLEKAACEKPCIRSMCRGCKVGGVIDILEEEAARFDPQLLFVPAK